MDNCKAEPDYQHIAFKGQLPHHEIVHYLNAADVFVLPSMAEGCPNSVIESMACGLPIISSALPFNDDILDEKNSICVNPSDVHEIADAILRLKSDQELSRRLAQGALTKAKDLRLEERTKKILMIIGQ
jgi:glycosyltransferase involved in cell wall biosynthesis